MTLLWRDSSIEEAASLFFVNSIPPINGALPHKDARNT
jgi:hypothetical protein